MARAPKIVVEPEPVDNVNHPPHYQGANGVECIDGLEAASTPEEFVAHLRLTALKYLWRAGKKGDLVEDLKKAQWYLNRAVTTLEPAETSDDE